MFVRLHRYVTLLLSRCRCPGSPPSRVHGCNRGRIVSVWIGAAGLSKAAGIISGLPQKQIVCPENRRPVVVTKLGFLKDHLELLGRFGIGEPEIAVDDEQVAARPKAARQVGNRPLEI